MATKQVTTNRRKVIGQVNSSVRDVQATLDAVAQALLDGDQDAATATGFHLDEVAIALYGMVVDWDGKPPKTRRPTRLRLVA